MTATPVVSVVPLPLRNRPRSAARNLVEDSHVIQVSRRVVGGVLAELKTVLKTIRASYPAVGQK